MSVTLVILSGGREMLFCSFPQDLRFIEEHDRPQRTFCQFEEGAGARFAGGPKVRWRFPSGVVQIRFFRRGDGPFRQREQGRALDWRDGALRAGVKFADGFDGVTEQLDADWAGGLGREDINDAAAHSELARQLHHFGSRVAYGTEMGDQFVLRNLGVFCQRPREIEIRCGILIAPKGGGDWSDYQGNLSIRYAKKRGSAT